MAPTSRGHLPSLLAYYAAGGKPWNHSDVGKGLVCAQCGNVFDAHPHKVREGKAKFCSFACRKLAKANENVSEDRRARNTPEYKAWRTAVFGRDAYRCRLCGRRGDINAHHIRPFKTYVSLRFAVPNGITLCESCHAAQHQRHLKRVYCVGCGIECNRRCRRCLRCHNRYASHSRWGKL